MKIIYMGTPDFAVAPLEAMIAAGHEIVLVVTQPDKPKGRGKEMQMTPVKQCAVKHGIPVFQPVKIKQKEEVEKLKSYEADIYVVAAFGQILSQEILDIPRLGCFNIHASLLPKYRGAAPIQWAIIDGEKETGVTIMRMDAGLDTGDMVSKIVVPITEKETGESLHDKLMEAGAKLIVETLPAIEDGTASFTKQEDDLSCYAKMLSKSMGLIEWSRSADEIERLVRGLNSWPSAYTYLEGKTCKIWEAKAMDESSDKEPGIILTVSKDAFEVSTGQGILQVSMLQLEGKKRMTVKDFLLGHAIVTGSRLGEKTK
ncbi:MAG: methionyl-tRNA formyltransferase [Lachnospiraceae bacterium]|jgi:methionyl-tRNA formyltransferase|nr:methionyl-tRNA formyltransferase [Lachnospiraceae bacterium]